MHNAISTQSDFNKLFQGINPRKFRQLINVPKKRYGKTSRISKEGKQNLKRKFGEKCISTLDKTMALNVNVWIVSL